MKLSAHRSASLLFATLAVLLLPVALVLGILTVFALAFLDYVPPDATFFDLAFSIPGAITLAFLLTLGFLIYTQSRIGAVGARCFELDAHMLDRMNEVREKCAAFYDQHGRAPSVEDRIELDAEDADVSSRFSKGAPPLVVLTGEDEIARLGGKHAIVSSAEPWKSSFGWHGIVLWEDGTIELLKDYSRVRQFYRAVDRVLANRRQARENGV